MGNDQHNLSFWWYITNFWTLIVFWAVICDFFTDNALYEYLGIFVAIYVALLAIYASDKEFERWYHFHHSQHPGELFVIAWTLVILLIFALDNILDRAYALPEPVISLYIAVLTILAITRRSKIIHQRKHGNNS